MGRRREEKVDEEELARLENPEGSPGKIRVKLPNDGKSKGELGYKGEMFALAEEILGGRRVTVLCADGETRMARIPGKMRRRQWVREGDLINDALIEKIENELITFKIGTTRIIKNVGI